MYKQLVIVLVASLCFATVGFSQDMSHKEGMKKEMKKEMMDKKEAMMDKEGMMDKMVKNISLEQIKGDFSVHGLTLAAGTYQFEIVNNNVGTNVGFVIAPAQTPDKHIKEAYVTEAVANNSSQKTNVVNLTPGEYIYFCPLNKTPQYKLTVI